MYGLTTHYNSKTCYQIFRLFVTVPNLCPQPKSSLISRSIMTVCWMLDQTSFRRHVNSSISHTEF